MATSGSLNTSGYEGRYLQLSWSRQSYDIASNPATSTIAWELRGAGSASSSWYYAGPFTVVIDGQTVYQSSSRIQLYAGTLVASGTTTLAHNTDGSRSFATSVSAAIFSSSPNVSGSGGWDLDALPRASTISCDPLTMGTAGTITITSASADFVHTVEYQFGAASGTIGYQTGSGTLMWNPSIDLAEQIPNSQYAAATLTCITYTGLGGSEIGRKSINVDLYTPPSMVPTISACTVSPVNTNGWLIPKNAYAAGWTKARVQTTAAGVKGSTIKSISITGIGTGNGADWTSGLLDAGVKTITITATDSRGRTASATRSITVLAYTPPVIAGLAYARGSYTGGVWTAADSGADVKVTFTLGLSLLDLENAAKLTVSLTDKTTQGPAWHGAGDWTYYFTAIGTDVSRKLTVLAEDGTGTQSTISIDVSTINVPVNINFDINGIRIGGVAEDAEMFRVSWQAKFDKTIDGTASNALTADAATIMQSTDTRNANYAPNDYITSTGMGVRSEFKYSYVIGVPTGTYVQLITFVPWPNSDGGLPSQVAIGNGYIYFRSATSTTAWGSWRAL